MRNLWRHKTNLKNFHWTANPEISNENFFGKTHKILIFGHLGQIWIFIEKLGIANF